jgi:polyphosphate kinase
VHVVYGLVGLKVHTKTALVVRDEPDGIRRYCHIGSGNYNSKTARIYEDVGLLTCDPAIGSDLTQLFNFLTGYGRDLRYQRLLVSPHTTRSGMDALIQNEIDVAATGAPASITLKMNSLVDSKMIDRLYDASAAGVEVDLIVRGICCLIPSVPGLSERIRVRSIVGRYLEHSRIFRFANGLGPGLPTVLIGSADLMPRNLDRRVEALVPVDEPELQARLEEILRVNLADDTLAWQLDEHGDWHHVEGGGTVDTHLRLQEIARTRARRLG